MATDLAQFTVYVTPELLAHLKAAAESEGRTLSNFVARALEDLCHPQDGFPLIPSRNALADMTRRPRRNALADLPDAIAAAVKRAPVKNHLRPAKGK